MAEILLENNLKAATRKHTKKGYNAQINEKNEKTKPKMCSLVVCGQEGGADSITHNRLYIPKRF